MTKEIPAVVEWMILEGVNPNDASWVDRQVDPKRASEVRRQRGLRRDKARKKAKNPNKNT